IGLPTTREESIERYQGRSWVDCKKLIEEGLGRPLPETFPEVFQRRMMEECHSSLTPIPGIAAALHRIPFPVCVASSSGHAHIRTVLEITGLHPHFDGRCFSAADVTRGKPQPDLFLHAAERMGFAAAASIVVEDSVSGVRGARAAGMRVLGFARDSDPGALQDAGARVFRDMEELPELIGSADAPGRPGRVHSK
ncbi:MAG: HAD-IA family hydrolase, partial [Myxococcota bacterium]